MILIGLTPRNNAKPSSTSVPPSPNRDLSNANESTPATKNKIETTTVITPSSPNDISSGTNANVKGHPFFPFQSYSLHRKKDHRISSTCGNRISRTSILNRNSDTAFLDARVRNFENL